MSQLVIRSPKDWKYSADLWKISIEFLQGLQWRSHQEAGLSCYEVAALFWIRTSTCPPAMYNCEQGRFSALPNWIRHLLRTIKKLKVDCFPAGDEWQARKCLYLSHTFPYGRWMGGRIWMSRDESLRIARFISSLPNGGKTAADWDVVMASFPWSLQMRDRSQLVPPRSNNNLFIFMKGAWWAGIPPKYIKIYPWWMGILHWF